MFGGHAVWGRTVPHLRRVSAHPKVTRLEREVTDAEARLQRLYRLVEEGVTEPDASSRDRIAELKALRDAAQGALERLKSHGQASIRLRPSIIAEFAQKMRVHVTADEITSRKAYLAAIVDRIDVGDHELRIVGRNDLLEQAVIADAAGQKVVRTFVPGWLGD
jgi:site-specific DNA recombinase